MKVIGRNQNKTDETAVNVYTINSVTPTVIATDNPLRTHLSVNLDGGISDIVVFVREYPAAQDSIKQGEVLSRRNSGNDTAFRVNFLMPEASTYTGEVSAITLAGTTDIHVIER